MLRAFVAFSQRLVGLQLCLKDCKKTKQWIAQFLCENPDGSLYALCDWLLYHSYLSNVFAHCYIVKLNI